MSNYFQDVFEGWDKFVEQTKGRPPRPLLIDALTHVKHRGAALDLGSGALNDSSFLLDEGFDFVTAVDAEPVAQNIADTFPPERFRYAISRFEDFDFAETAFDLINAQFALPFIHPDKFDGVFRRVLEALRPGGVITGQLFGDRDEWAATDSMTFHNRELALQVLQPLQILHFDEEDNPHATIASGARKHWHLFHFIAAK